MNILRQIFGKKGEAIDDPAVLRDRLFEAVARNDAGDLSALCHTNRDVIRRAYSAWLKQDPELFGSDPRRVEWYGRNLFAIGECFARSGDRSLLEKLQRPAEKGPFRKWDAELRACIEMVRMQDFEGALARLAEFRKEVRTFAGFPAKRMEGLVVGYMGTCLQQMMRAEEALDHYEDASLLCEEARDHEGVLTHLGNRIETLRWLGRHPDAAPLAEKLAEMLESNGRPVEAARYRTRARVMAVGEPLLRLLFRMGDRVYEEDELPAQIEGSVKILFERNRTTLARCQQRMEEGGRHVGQGRYEEALASFGSALEADLYAPEPHYESASVHMLLGRYPQAIECYEKTERLAPGWFLVRSEGWLARQLAAGRFHADVPMMLLALEDHPSEGGVALAQTMCDRFEDLPQAWLLLGERLQRAGRGVEAEAAYRRGLGCAEERDVRTRLLTSLGAMSVPYRRAELEQAAALDGHLVAGSTARVLLRSGKAA